MRWLVVSPEYHSPDQSTSIRVRFGMRVPVEEEVHRGVVHAWVGQIVLVCDESKTYCKASVPLRRALGAATPLAAATADLS